MGKALRKTKDRATVDYIKQMLRELRDMAEASRDDELAYMIEMASIAAFDRLREIHAAELKAELKVYFQQSQHYSELAEVNKA